MADRLLLITESLEGGGAERVFTTLLRRLDRRLFEPHLALVRKCGKYLSELPADVTVHDLKASRTRYAFLSIIRLVRELKPSVVLSTLAHVNITVTASRPLWPRKTRLLIREANISPSTATSSYPRVYSWLHSHLYPLADIIICLTEDIRCELIETCRAPESKVRVIANPVDVDMVKQRAAELPAQFSSNEINIVAAGSFTRQKGFDLLIRAFAPVVRRNPDARLTILGSGPEEVALRSLADSLQVSEFISMPGFVQNPYPHFRAASLFVLSSRWEGLPNVALEALACGTPIVAFDCIGGGIQEIRRKSADVVVVPRENVHALTKAIEENLDRKKKNPRPCLLPRDFHVDSVIREYEKILTG